MTAINVILQPEAAHLITDGSGQNGEVTYSTMPKVLPLPHLNAVMALRGHILVFMNIYHLIVVRHHSYKDALGNMAADLREAVEAFAKHLPLAVGTEYLLVGWPESGEVPQCHLCVDSDPFGYGVTPFQPMQFPGFASPCDERLSNAFNMARLGSGFDPDVDGLDLIEAQRDLYGDDGRVVGGFCQVTTLRRDSISTRIARRWDG